MSIFFQLSSRLNDRLAMNNTCYFTAIFLLMGLSCSNHQNNETTIQEFNFDVNGNYILMNGDPLVIKGIVYVPGYPGYLPWEIENSVTLSEGLKSSIYQDIQNIKSLGVNTIRLWGAPKYCYQAIKEVGDLKILQTIWFETEQSDLQDELFKMNCKIYIKDIIDRVYSAYRNVNPPVIAYIVGNELSYQSIVSTNNLHPEIFSYYGEYIRTDSTLTATESFIAEMADYVKKYEYENYDNISLVTYANDIRTAEILDTPFLDFRSHNAYSYAVDYYLPQPPVGSTSGTIFQGWIEYLKNLYPTQPLLITETGLSVSPNSGHIGPPNYGYGGNTESEQAQGLTQNIQDVLTSSDPIAGIIVHEYLDAWWKFGLEDSYTQDPDDVEEWFGIVKLISSGNWFETAFRRTYYELQEIWNN